MGLIAGCGAETRGCFVVGCAGAVVGRGLLNAVVNGGKITINKLGIKKCLVHFGSKSCGNCGFKVVSTMCSCSAEQILLILGRSVGLECKHCLKSSDSFGSGKGTGMVKVLFGSQSIPK